ncbi:MAG: hypothetical protein AAGH99_07450 [Planctomycetota bacterium]
MCVLPLRRLPDRKARGTNPIASQNRFADRSWAHQQQNSRTPYALRSNIDFSSVAPTNPPLPLRVDVHLVNNSDILPLEVPIDADAIANQYRMNIGGFRDDDVPLGEMAFELSGRHPPDRFGVLALQGIDERQVAGLAVPHPDGTSGKLLGQGQRPESG